MHFIVLSGVKRAARLTVFSSIVNIITISVTLSIMVLFVGRAQFSVDVWGQEEHLGSILTQVKSTMLVTLWAFLGIEAAVVVSDRAKGPKQVGMATFVGLAVCTLLYFLLSALPFGVMDQKELAGLSNPSAAYVLEALIGHWGAVFVILSLLFSEMFCWLAWTILVAELPYEGAKGGVFPRFLSRENRHHAAAPSLWMSSIVMQRHGCLDRYSWYALFRLASLRGRSQVSAFVDDRFRYRPAGLLVCAEGTCTRQARLHSHRAGRGGRARHRGGCGHGPIRDRNRQWQLTAGRRSPFPGGRLKIYQNVRTRVISPRNKVITQLQIRDMKAKRLQHATR